MQKKYVVKDILKKHNITSWFQPIINVERQELIGWEAFSRGPDTEQGLATPDLFDTAADAGILKPFDVMCIQSASQCFGQLQLSGKLFLNLTNEMLIASSKLKDQVAKMIADSELPPAQMVLEIDEKNAAANEADLIEAVHFFHQHGFEVAVDHLTGIDNIGESEELHKLWEELRPDYIKLDRSFIEKVNGSATKQKTIKEVVAVARSLDSIVVAEGVETEKELLKLYELGVHNVQGYFIQRPELAPVPPKISRFAEKIRQLGTSESSLACDLVVTKDAVDIETNIGTVFNLFDDNIRLNSIAVLNKEFVVGMVYRREFMDKFSKRQRREVVQEKSISTEMNTDFLKVDAHLRIEQVSRLLTARARTSAEHDFAITSEDQFLGIGTMVDLLRKVTQLRARPDHQENILTMLPGNTPIGRCISELFDKNEPFTVALLDLSNFKPFNNHYSHNKGNEVLIMFAELLRKHIKNTPNVAGHLGGDDFILIIPEVEWETLLTALFSEFSNRAQSFYSRKDIDQGGIESTDRNGHTRLFDFVSLSAGVMTITEEYFDSFQTLLSQLIKLKQRTKREGNISLAHLKESRMTLYSFDDTSFQSEGVSD